MENKIEQTGDALYSFSPLTDHAQSEQQLACSNQVLPPDFILSMTFWAMEYPFGQF